MKYAGLLTRTALCRFEETFLLRVAGFDSQPLYGLRQLDHFLRCVDPLMHRAVLPI